MDDHYSPLWRSPITEPISFLRPPAAPERVRLGNPAVDVMTDFSYVTPRTTTIDVSIDEGLEYMKTSGVRSLLVIDEAEDVIGLVSSYDIQGEKPIKLIEQLRLPRSGITIGQVMVPRRELKVVDMLSVRSAQVGHVVATLRDLEVRYLLISQVGEQEEAPMEGLPDTYMRGTEWEPVKIPSRASGKRWIRGLFSAAQVSRQLGVDLMTLITPAHSLSELEFRGAV
ncbi:MAG: hypothetical protein WB783_03570 [Arenicellales bacterium]